jgi:hypothetical protein
MRCKPCFALGALIFGAGCSTFSPDGGMNAVNELTRSRIRQDAAWIRSENDVQSARAATREMLANPLTADAAVKIALLNNRGLQAAYSDLGIAEADVVQAGRVRNPGFSFARLRRADEIEIDRTFLFDVLGLVTMPLRTELEQRRFALTQMRAAADVHGYDFAVTCTDGGWVPKSAQWPEVSIDVGVGQMRAFEFVADEPGDWAIHCHKSHHSMNPMGHRVPNMVGVDHRGVAEKIIKLIPDYMATSERGMAEMGAMEMPLPENTLPMMTGQGPFVALEMGGMFSVVKVREGLAKNDYKDPGWFKHPQGTIAREWTGSAPVAARAAQGAAPEHELRARKPSIHGNN